MTAFVMVPGIGGSDAEHWQSRWEPELDAARISPGSWDAPVAADWLAAIDEAAGPDTILVAHSLGCLAVAMWLDSRAEGAAGAFLVAPPDPDADTFPEHAVGFGAPERRLHTPAVVVASTNDPYGTIGHAHARAERWAAALVDAGPLGHLNSASGLGDWRTGRDLLAAFAAGCRRAPR